MINTSLGPESISISVPLLLAKNLDLVTYWFPGPKILSTFGIVFVPIDKAAID